uniref:Uncharacterized protein n=1 Tax=Oryza rufipogon TaxID=4529 RepID=A0A0E0P693_ORYRU
MAAALRAGLRRCRPAASPPEFGGREAATTARLPIAAECREVRPAGGEEREYELKLGFKPATSLQPKSAYLVT